MRNTVTKGAANIIGGTSNIVSKAAHILEQNIAEGILAAQKVEKKFINTDKVRADKDDIINKFREDTHQALDIMFDSLALATQKIQEFSTKIEELNVAAKATKTSVPILSIDNFVSPGDEIVFPLTLENESKKEEMQVEFFDQGLQADESNIIHKKNITYDPKILNLKPGEKGVLNIKIHVPKNTKGGIYTGIINARNLPDLEAILRLEVKSLNGN